MTINRIRKHCTASSPTAPHPACDQHATSKPSRPTNKPLFLLMFAMLLATLLLPSTRATADLLHNSTDTGSGTTKWPNGWGVAGGQYGKFVCATCHEPDAENLKNVRSVLSTMTSNQVWPNGQRSVSVVFQNQTSMGDDRQKHNKSNRICEVCHSRNDFHNYSSGNNKAMGHPTNVTSPIVCVSCHKHNTGFKAACGNCHGNPPTTAVLGTFSSMVSNPRPSNALPPGKAGAHNTHTNKRDLVCETCHYVDPNASPYKDQPTMPNQSRSIQIGFFGFGGLVTSGTYTPYTSATRGYPYVSGTPNTIIAQGATSYGAANICSNVYCHGGGVKNGSTVVKAPLTNGTDQTPQWDATGQSQCGTCHGRSSTSPPTLGSHAKHAGADVNPFYGYGYSCDTCHPNNTNNDHVQGNLRWSFSTTDPKVSGAKYKAYGQSTELTAGSTGGLAPSDNYGTCSNVNCHKDGQGGPANVPTPRWGDNSPFTNCEGCHGGNAGTSPYDIRSGKHTAHINNALRIGKSYGCVECHATTVSSDTVISNRGNHVNMIVNYSGAKAGRVKTSCNAAYCHSDGKGRQGVPVDWNTASSPLFATCSACHGNASPQEFSSVAGEPNYFNTGAPGSATANNHRAHAISASVAPTVAQSCSVCHVKTVTPAGLAILGTYSAHINKKIDVNFSAFNASGSYTNPRCANLYCHSYGNAASAPFRVMSTALWGGTLPTNCAACHGGAGATSGRFRVMSTGRHQKHMRGTNFAAVNLYYNYACSDCHTSTVSGNSTISNPANHVNYQVDVAFSPALGGTYPSTGHAPGVDATRTCANVYCHSNGQIGGQPGTALVFRNLTGSKTWYGTISSLGCSGCHGSANTVGLTALSGKHGVHLSTTINPEIGTALVCADCHLKTRLTSGWNDRNKHNNHFVDYSGVRAGGQANLNIATGVCSNVYCHGDGKGIFKPMSSSGWFSSRTLGCTGCHGSSTSPVFTSQAGEPNYATPGANQQRSNSHLAHTTKIAGQTGAASCEICHFNTVTTAGTAIKAASSHVNRAINVDFNPTKEATALWDSGLKKCTNIACHFNGDANWGDTSSVSCRVCHGNLSATHSKHIGDLLTSGAVTFYNFTANRSDAVTGEYRFGCANCHPIEATPGQYHRNGQIDLSISKNKPGAGFLNTLNTQATADRINVAGSGLTGTSTVSVTCELAYCHSNGRSLTPSYKPIEWYAGSFGNNKCGGCHDNPPQYVGQSHYVAESNLGRNGVAPAKDSGHLINIHFRSTAKGNLQNGFLGFSSAGNKAHGNTAYSTTISCYTCHADTVSSNPADIDTYTLDNLKGTAADSRFRCGKCHTTTTPTPLRPGKISNARLHINGSKDIKLAGITFQTKAQIVNQSNALGWSRQNGYKSAAGNSFDTADLSASTWLRDSANNNAVTCTTLCHVNQANIWWGRPDIQCASCHANQ